MWVRRPQIHRQKILRGNERSGGAAMETIPHLTNQTLFLLDTSVPTRSCAAAALCPTNDMIYHCHCTIDRGTMSRVIASRQISSTCKVDIRLPPNPRLQTDGDGRFKSRHCHV